MNVLNRDNQTALMVAGDKGAIKELFICTVNVSVFVSGILVFSLYFNVMREQHHRKYSTRFKQ